MVQVTVRHDASGESLSLSWEQGVTIEQFLEQLGTKFNIPTDLKSLHILLRLETGQLLTTADLPSLPAQCAVLLRNGALEAADNIALLTKLSQPVEDSEKKAKLESEKKKAVFQLKDHLKSDMYAEEFISQGGMDVLLTVVRLSEGNTQAYALSALSATMGYLNGLEYIKSSPGLIEKLFQLISSPSTNVVRQALALVFVVCELLSDGFELVHAAAKTTARRFMRAPYATLIADLESGDLGIKSNALTLINVLMKRAPDEKKLAKLVHRFELLGVREVLERQAEIQHQDFQMQLNFFQATTGSVIPSSHYEVEVYKSKVKELSIHCEQLAEKLRQFEEQQPLIRILRAELLRYQSAVRQAVTSGAYVNAHGPLHRSSKQSKIDALQQASGRPVDVSFLLDVSPEIRARLGTLEQEKAELQAKLNEAVTARVQTEEALNHTNNVYQEAISTVAQAERLTAQLDALMKERDDALRALQTYKSQPLPAAATAPTQPTPGLPVSGSPLPPPPMPGMGVPLPPPPMPGMGVPLPPPPMPGMGVPLPPPPMPGMRAPGPPPLPGMGGAPPPPMLPGAPGAPPPLPGMGAPRPPGLALPVMNMAPQPTKPVIKPKTKMKPLHWTRILNPSGNDTTRTNTVWEAVKEPRLDGREIEALFGQKMAADKAAEDGPNPSATPRGGAKPKSTKTRVLEDQRSNAIAIMLSKLPALPIIKEGIKKMDERALKREHLTAIMAQLPTEEELALLNQNDGPDTRWDRPEEFLLTISTIPKLKLRLRCWIFKVSFNENVEQLAPNLSTIQKACKELKSSPSFKIILGYVLALGNYMNGGTAKGQADGFQLDVLVKLTGTKDIANQMTLLQFLARQLQEKHPACLALADEIPHVAQAKSVNLADTEANVKRMSAEVKDVQRTVDQILSTTQDPEDPFNKIMPKFVREADDVAARVSLDLKEALQSYEELLLFFGYNKNDLKTKTSEEFFGLVTTFVNELNKAAPAQDKPTGSGYRRKHDIGTKITAGDDPMSAVINAIKAGNTAKGLGSA